MFHVERNKIESKFEQVIYLQHIETVEGVPGNQV